MSIVNYIHTPHRYACMCESMYLAYLSIVEDNLLNPPYLFECSTVFNKIDQKLKENRKLSGLAFTNVSLCLPIWVHLWIVQICCTNCSICIDPWSLCVYCDPTDLLDIHTQKALRGLEFSFCEALRPAHLQLHRAVELPSQDVLDVGFGERHGCAHWHTCAR